MTRVQRINLKLSEKRQAIGTMLDAPVEERSETWQADLDTAKNELKTLESELQAALLIEPEPTETRDADTSEGREIRQLIEQSELSAYFNSVLGETALDGAERELRQALLGDDARENWAPLDLLETRAVTPVAAAAVTEGNQQPIAGRVFARSVPGLLSIPMPTVAAGSAGYPHLASGTTFSNQQPSGEQAAVAGSFGGSELNPIRATASYEYRTEDEVKLVGVEDSLRRDLSAGLSNHFSDQVVNGNGTAPNVSGILNAVSATPGTDPNNADDFGEIAARFFGEVDGLTAYEQSDLRVIMAPDTYEHAVAVYRGNQSPVNAYENLRANLGLVSVSDHLPDAASDISLNIVHKASFPERNAVMPVWRNLAIIRDPFTLAQKGEVRLTVAAFWNFAILEDDAWAVKKVHD